MAVRRKYGGRVKFTEAEAQRSVELRFWAGLRKDEDGCWRWTGGTTHGYGVIHSGGPTGRRRKTHRLSYEIHKGPIPPGAVVMHSCDNKVCCNPAHLSVGTIADNVTDMVKKGRQARQMFTREDVLKIRASTERISKLARKLNVHESTVSKIKSGDRYTWVG